MHVVQGGENDVPSHALDCQHELQYRRRGYRVTNLRLVGDDRELRQAFRQTLLPERSFPHDHHRVSRSRGR